MKSTRPATRHPRAFTLLEMTIVIMVVIALAGIGMSVSGNINELKLGKQAGETLRTVYSAQRMYLADNPTVAVTSITNSNIIPYLPNNATSVPKITSLNGTELTIKVDVIPPVVNAGDGTVYDPSGNSKDTLWDVGE